MDSEFIYFIAVIIAAIVVFSILFIGVYIANHNAAGKSKYCNYKDEDFRPFIAGQCHNT